MPRKTVEITCQVCGAKAKTRQKDIDKGYGKYCSRRCSATARHQTVSQIGKNNPNWKNGRSANPYASYVQRYKEANPKKVKAHNLISTEYRANRLSPKPCEECGNPDAEAHHGDYSKPYELTWLCRKCHIEAHN